MVPLMHLVRRLGRQRLVSMSILLGVGLAVALGVAVPLVTGALAALSLRTSITTLTPAVRNIQLFRTPAPFDPSLQAHIRQQLGSLLAADYRMSYLPTVYGQPAAPRPNRQVRLRTQEGLADHIVVTGRASQPASTPAPGDCQPHGSTFPVLVSAEQLQASTLAVGDHVCVDGKISVMIAGSFVPKDPTDQYWFNDQRPIIGESPPGPTITTLIVVLMLNDDDFNTIWLRWYGNELVAHFFRGFVQSSAITLDTVDDVANHLDALRAEFKAVSSSPIVMQTGLEDAITTFETRFQLLESVLFALFLLLVSLAMIYVVLVGTLATQQQEGEIALLRSRGGSARQVLLVQICQSLVLAVPSAVLGWGVGQLSVFLLERTALFQQLGGSATITWRFILVAAELGGAMLLIAVLGLAFAAWRALAHSSVTLRTAWARPSREAGWRRWQLDVLLLLFAAWAWWQLQRSGGSLITTPNGVVHIDLLVLAAPTLLLIVGALVFLRLFPFVARGLGTLLRRRRGLVLALSTWQLARNPVLYGQLVLLLTLTVGLGVYSQIVNGTITRSQVRHALDVAGADVRIPLDPHDDPATILATIPAAASTLVSRVDTQYLGEQGQSTVAVQDTMVLLGIDGPALSTVLAASGSDDAGWLAALRSLGAATTPLGLPLPAGTTAVEVQLQSLVTEVMVYAKFGGANGERLVALGHPGAAWQDFQAPLPRDLQQPVSLQSFIVAPKKEEVSMSGQPLVFDQLTARVGTTEVPLGSFEQLDGWEAIAPSIGDAHLSATFGVKGDLSAAQLRVATLRPGEWAALRLRVPFTVEGYLAQAAGDTEAHARQPVVRIGDQEFAVKVRQRLGQFPGVADQPTALIASRDHLQALLSYGKPTTERPQELAPSDPTRFQSDLPTSLLPTELWVALQPGAQPRLGPNAVTKATALFVQQADPLGNGLYVALVLGFGCALLFSLIGFLTSNALTIQARALDWAVLGSLGLARRELLWIIAAEQGVVLGGSLVGGSVVGLLLAALTRPLLQVVAGNIANEPAHVDWLGLLLLLGGLLLAFAIALVAMLVNVQRRGLTRALRLGEV